MAEAIVEVNSYERFSGGMVDLMGLRDPRPGLAATLWIVVALFLVSFHFQGGGMLGALVIALLAPGRRSADRFWERWGSIVLASAGLLWFGSRVWIFADCCGGDDPLTLFATIIGLLWMQIVLSVVVVVVVYGGTLSWQHLRWAREG